MNKLIPCGIRCFDARGICPYYNKACVIYLNRDNCRFRKSCNKVCKDEQCKNVFIECEYKNKIENSDTGEFLLSQKYKICGENLKE